MAGRISDLRPLKGDPHHPNLNRSTPLGLDGLKNLPSLAFI